VDSELPSTPPTVQAANNDFREAASVNIETVRLSDHPDESKYGFY